MPKSKSKSASPLDEHKKAYEKVIKLQKQAREAMLDLEDARKNLTLHLADKLREVEGIEERVADPAGAAVARGVASIPEGYATSPEPIDALVDAAESRYLQFMGRDKVEVPLSIYILNNHTLLGLKCPNCDHEIEPVSPYPVPIPEGTRGR